MDLVPESLDGAIVINALSQAQVQSQSVEGIDYGVGLHNWLMSTNLRYLIFDLQDEKEINPSFIEDMMQLMRRTRIPILFCGVMSRPKSVLESFDYGTKYQLFNTPDQAIHFLRNRFPTLLQTNYEGINFGQPIEMVRSRLGLRTEEGEEGEGSENESEDVEEAEAEDDSDE